MSLVIDSSPPTTAQANSGATSLNYIFTNVAGTELLVAVVVTGNNSSVPTTTGVTYNGVSMTLVPSSRSTWDNATAEVSWWYLASPATGAKSVVVSASWTGSPVYKSILSEAISFTGAGTPTNAQIAGSGTSSGTTASLSFTGSTNGSIVLSALGTGTGVTSATSPTVLDSHVNQSTSDAGDNYGQGHQPTTGGTVTISYTIGNDVWGISAVEIPVSGTVKAFPPFNLKAA